tara:strand:- start:799 stop:972 length:174 start_codon:yes stop_codon:yes gene_type:complete
MFQYDESLLSDVLWKMHVESQKEIADLKSQLIVAEKVVENLQAQIEDNMTLKFDNGD